MNVWWLIPVVAVFSFALPAFLRRYALSRSLIDVPNQRSSHTIPTPRGGGVAIVLTFICALFFLFHLSLTTEHALIALAANIAQLHDTHRIERCALFDQFPYTHHMESGVLLVRR